MTVHEPLGSRLKTVKDFEVYGIWKDNKDDPEGNAILVDELKAEAIKWVKALETYYNEEGKHEIPKEIKNIIVNQNDLLVGARFIRTIFDLKEAKNVN